MYTSKSENPHSTANVYSSLEYGRAKKGKQLNISSEK